MSWPALSQHRLRLRWALGLSLLVHMGVALVVWRLPPTQAVSSHVPFEWHLSLPEEVPAAPASAAPQAQRGSSKRAAKAKSAAGTSASSEALQDLEAATAGDPPPAGVATAPSGFVAAPAPPEAVDLFPKSLGVGPAPEQRTLGAQDSPGEEGALVQRRLDAMRDAHRNAQSADHLPKSFAQLAEGLHAWFIPRDEALENARPIGRERPDIAALAADLLRGDEPSGDNARRAAEPLFFPKDTRLDPASVIGKVACFGACDGGSHEIAGRAVLVDVTHDAGGAPKRWRVALSSGDTAFDEEALSAFKEATSRMPAAAWSVPPTPRVSRWELTARAYRWSRSELLLDPGWTPPGREWEAKSGLAQKVTTLRSVRLVAVDYQR